MSLKDILGNDFAGNLSQLKEAMLANTPVVQQNTTAKTEATTAYKTMFEELKKVNSSFVTEIKNISTQLAQAVDKLKTPAPSNSEKKSGSDFTSAIDSLQKCLCERKLNEQNKSFLTSMSKILNKQFRELKQEIAKCCLSVRTEGLPKPDSGTPSVESSVEPSADKSPSSDRENEFEKIQKRFALDSIRTKFIGFFQDIQGGIEKVFFDMGEKKSLRSMLFGEMTSQEANFLREVRELSFETKGITGDMKDAQSVMTDIGQTVAITGQDRTTFQKQYVENLKKGITDSKTLSDITKQTLGFEKLLGMKAGELSDTFVELQNTGMVNVNQTAAMGRGMQQVQRNTGLTGENLKKAVESSKAFVQNMTKAATLTASAANNVMSIVANAQKLGVGDAVGKLLPAMTSSAELLMGSSKEVQAFLYNAAGAMGKTQDLMTGTITRSKRGLKDLASGMEQVLQGFGVRSLEEIENLSDQAKMNLNIQLKTSFGMELGEITRVVQSFKESGKGLGEQLDELNKKRRLNLTLEEKTALAEKERLLKTDAAMNVLTGLSEAAKGASNMNEALSKFGMRSQDYLDDIKAFGGTAGSTTQAIESSLNTAVANLNEGLRTAGEKEIEINTEDITKALQDKDQYNLLIQRLEQGNLKLQNAQKASVDPTLKTANTLAQYNDYFRNDYTQPLLKGIQEMVGYSGSMAFALTSIGIELSLISLKLAASYGRDFMDLKDNIRKLFTGGDGAVSPTLPTAPKSPTAPTAPTAPKSGGKGSLDFANMDMSQLAKAGKNLAIMSAGLIVIGTGIVLLSALAAKVVSSFNIDPLQTAKDISLIILGATAIIIASGAAYLLLDKAMQQFGDKLDPSKMKAVAIFAGKLAAFGTALVILGTGILFLTKKLLGFAGLDAAQIWELNVAILGIMAAVGILTGAMLVVTLTLTALKTAVGTLIATGPATVATLATLSWILPLMAVALFGIGIAIIKGAKEIASFSSDMSLGEITKTVAIITVITLATAALVAGVAFAAEKFIKLAEALNEASMKPGFWKGMLLAAGLIVVALFAIAGIAAILYYAFKKMDDIDAADFKERSEKVALWLDGVNAVILRLVPIMAIIGGLAVLGAVADKFLSGAGWLAAYAGIIGLAMFLIIPALLMLAKVIYNAAAQLSGSENINPKEVKSVTDKMVLILDSVNTMLLRLAPMAGIILGLSVAAVLLGWMAVGVAIVAGILALALPLLVTGLLKLGLAIYNSAAELSKGVNIDKASVELTLQKIDLIVYAVEQLTTAAGSLAWLAGKNSIGLGVGMLGMYALVPLLEGYMKDVISFGKIIGQLETSFGGVKPERLIVLSKVIMAIRNGVEAIVSMVKSLQSTQGLFGGGIDISGLVDQFAQIKGSIVRLMMTLNEINLNVVSLGMQSDFGKADATFKSVASFSKSVQTFMGSISKMTPSKKTLKYSQEFTQKKTLYNTVNNFVTGIKELTDIPEKAKIDRKKLILTGELFKSINEVTTSMSGGLENMEKAIGILTKSKKINIDQAKLKTAVGNLVGTMEAVILSLAPVAGSQALYEAPAALAALDGMKSIFVGFGAGLDEWVTLAKKVNLAANVKNFYDLFLKQDQELGKAQEEQQKKSGATKPQATDKDIPTFMQTLKVMISNFSEIVKATTTDEFTDVASKVGIATSNLKLIGPTLEEYSKALDTFYIEMDKSFGPRKKSWGVVWQGQGKGMKLAAWTDIGRIISLTADNIKSISIAFNKWRDGDIAALSSRIFNASGAIGDTADKLTAYGEKITALYLKLKNDKNFAWLNDRKPIEEKFQQLEYLLAPHAVMVKAIQESMDYYFGSTTGSSIDNFNAWNKNINSWVDALGVIPGKIATAVSEIKTLAAVKLPSEQEQQNAVAAVSALGAFGGELSKQAENYLKAFTLTEPQKQALISTMTGMGQVVSSIAGVVAGYNQAIYIPAISPDGMLSEKNKENLVKTGQSITSFMKVLDTMVKDVNSVTSLNAEQMTAAATKIDSVVKVIDLVVNVIGQFNNKFATLTVVPKNENGDAIGKSILQNINDNIPLVKDTFQTIAAFTDAVRGTMVNLPEPNALEGFTKKIEMIGGTAKTISEVMETINKVATILTDTTVDGKTNYIQNVDQMISTLKGGGGKTGIADVITKIAQDVIWPLNNLQITVDKHKQDFYPEDIQESAKTLQALSSGVMALGSMFDALHVFQGKWLTVNTAVDESGKPVDTSGLNKLGRLTKDMDQYEPAIKAMVKLAANLLKILLLAYLVI